MYALRGILNLILMLIWTICVFTPLVIMALIALVLPDSWAARFHRWMELWLYLWTGFNQWLFRNARVTQIDLDWPERSQAGKDRWYLVICNHQSWTDIVVLQSIFWNTVPGVKFFTKQELIWVPFIGLGMSALGFPYVKRATKAQIKQNPELRHADRESIEQACRRFLQHPTTILNFLEGTRYTPEKHARQAARFEKLLNPKVGGISTVMRNMDGHLDKVLDVTIHYPHGTPNFWTFIQGRCPSVSVHVEPLEPPPIDASIGERDYRREVSAWIEERWKAKDHRLNSA